MNANKKDKHQRCQTQLRILHDLGKKLTPSSIVLDLGCGNGALVNEYLNRGYDAYGCDFRFKEGEYVEYLYNREKIRKIDIHNYKLPFGENIFDFVFTDQVFEHVKDYPVTLAEIRRVLKPDGICLNFFPSKYQIIEPHVFVPFASINKNYYWLLFWAYLGIRKSNQKGFTAPQTARKNYEYLNNYTHYLSKSEIRKYCAMYFANVEFVENIFLRHLRRFRFFSMFSQTKIIPWLYGTFRSRVLVLSQISISQMSELSRGSVV